jgi:outer membrane cobalamin receptor
MRLKALFIALLFTVAFTALGQQAVIKGRVTDAVTLQPLPRATILYDRSGGTVSDLNGEFVLTINPGRASLRFQYVGYKNETREITLTAGDTLQLMVTLEPDVTQIDQVVVSAGRVEQRVAESTVSMSIMRPQQYSASHISDSRELITKSPGIEVIDGQASIRGGSGYSYGAGSRVLTLLDGLPIIGADAGSIRWQFLPMENVSQIEIIKGASSVLYGSLALNGVINFRTARATPQGQTGFWAETGVFDNPPNPQWKWWGSTPRLFNSVSFSHLKKYNNTEVGVGAYGILDQGYRKLNHENIGRINVSLRQHSSLMQGLEFGLNTLVGYTDKRDFLLWENATDGALKQSESTAINLRGTFLAIDPFIGISSTGQYSHDLRMRFQLTDNTFPDSPENESTALSLLTEYQAWFNINPLFNLNAGVLHNASRIFSPFFGDHESVNLAGYVQTDLSIGQRLKMVGGVRLEHNNLNGVSDGVVPLFRAGMNYMALSHTFLRASFGQGYRYPSIAEKHAATTLGAIRIFPNLLLQPESGWSTEVGLKQGVTFQGWDGLVDVALFYMRNNDLIEYLFGIYPDPASGLSIPGFRADNTEYSRVLGTETEFMLLRSVGQFEHTISGGYMYTHPVEYNKSTGKSTDVYLKYRRKHSAKLSFYTRYRNIEPGVDLFFRSKTLNIDDVFVQPGTREDILPGFFQYWTHNNKGYFLIDLNVGYHLRGPYKLSVAVKNLANQEYMGRPGDIRPHRNFSLRLSAMF